MWQTSHGRMLRWTSLTHRLGKLWLVRLDSIGSQRRLHGIPAYTVRLSSPSRGVQGWEVVALSTGRAVCHAHAIVNTLEGICIASRTWQLCTDVADFLDDRCGLLGICENRLGG